MSRASERDPAAVRRMFEGISRRYDLLNHLLSLNADRRWRRAAAAEAAPVSPAPVLDLCGGTGDLAIAVARAHARATVICCDFAHSMLELAGTKFRRHGLGARCLRVEADGLRLPFRDGTFGAVTVGFGVRNFVDLDAGLRESERVLVPGGCLVVLEFSTPTSRWLSPLFGLYLRRLLPRVGDRVSGRSGPYGYLARTIAAFPDPATLAGRIREAGFAACGWKRLSGGIVALHTAFKRR